MYEDKHLMSVGEVRRAGVGGPLNVTGLGDVATNLLSVGVDVRRAAQELEVRLFGYPPAGPNAGKTSAEQSDETRAPVRRNLDNAQEELRLAHETLISLLQRL